MKTNCAITSDKALLQLLCLICVLTLLSGCGDPGAGGKADVKGNAINESFVTQLDENGYFRGLSPEKAQALKDDFRKEGWMAVFSDSHRLYHADAENLAEGGICEFIHQIQPFLTSQGVALPDLHDEFSEKDYSVRVGSTSYRIYEAAEIQKDRSDGQLGLIWGLAMTRGFAVVNKLLESAGSSERVYAINGGNDLYAIFLTPELHQIISAHPDADAKDGPYKPTEEYPWFGQPHGR